MTATFAVTVLMIARLVIPALIILSLGELVKDINRRYHYKW